MSERPYEYTEIRPCKRCDSRSAYHEPRRGGGTKRHAYCYLCIVYRKAVRKVKKTRDWRDLEAAKDARRDADRAFKWRLVHPPLFGPTAPRAKDPREVQWWLPQSARA